MIGNEERARRRGRTSHLSIPIALLKVIVRSNHQMENSSRTISSANSLPSGAHLPSVCHLVGLSYPYRLTPSLIAFGRSYLILFPCNVSLLFRNVGNSYSKSSLEKFVLVVFLGASNCPTNTQNEEVQNRSWFDPVSVEGVADNEREVDLERK